MVIHYLFVARKSSNTRYRSRVGILHIGQLETRPQRDAAFSPLFRTRIASPAVLGIMLAMLRQCRKYIDLYTCREICRKDRNHLLASMRETLDERISEITSTTREFNN